MAIPDGNEDPCPASGGVGQQGLSLRQRRAFLRRPTERRSGSFRGRCEQAGIQPQAADERCPSYDSMRQFMNGKAAVTYKDDPRPGSQRDSCSAPCRALHVVVTPWRSAPFAHSEPGASCCCCYDTDAAQFQKMIDTNTTEHPAQHHIDVVE
jgi:hypothetical protein